jgi:hypothetical protein
MHTMLQAHRACELQAQDTAPAVYARDDVVSLGVWQPYQKAKSKKLPGVSGKPGLVLAGKLRPAILHMLRKLVGLYMGRLQVSFGIHT